MMEVINAQRCRFYDICASPCPTIVLDKTDGIPMIARGGEPFIWKRLPSY